MIRNLKVLGLALVAVFAMSAMVASVASAQGSHNGILTSDGPMTLIGTQTGGAGANRFNAFGGKVECESAIYTGHKYNVTPHEKIPSGETTVTITPHYGTCTTNLVFNFPTIVDMNGCDYVFHLTETVAGTVKDEYKITATIVCPKNAHIVLTLFTNGTKEEKTADHFCDITITEAASYDGLIARDTTNGDIDVTGTIKNIVAHKKTNPWDPNKALCSEQTTEVAELTIDATIKDSGGTAIGISHT